MRKNKAFLTIFVIVFVDLLGFGLVLPLLPYVAEQFKANPFAIGVLSAAYPFFQFLSSPVLGRLSDRYGRKKLLIISQIGTMLGYLLLAFANSMPLLFLARIIDGMTGGNISIAQAYIADVTEPKDRAKAMGMLGAAFGLGFILGPVIGGLLSQFGLWAPALFAAFISLITVFATSMYLKESVNVAQAQHSTKTAFTVKSFARLFNIHTLALLLGIFLLVNIAFASMQGVFSLWAEHSLGYGPTQTGFLFGFVGIVAVITQIVFLPRLLKMYKETLLMKVGLFCLGLGFASFALISFTPFAVYLAITLIAFGNGISGPTLQALASETVRKEEYGEVLGILQSSGSLGRIGGPLIAGTLYNQFGPQSPFEFSAGVMVLVVLILIVVPIHIAKQKSS